VKDEVARRRGLAAGGDARLVTAFVEITDVAQVAKSSLGVDAWVNIVQRQSDDVGRCQCVSRLPKEVPRRDWPRGNQSQLRCGDAG